VAKANTAPATQRLSRVDAMMMGAVAAMTGLVEKLFGPVR
jgi:hypothetical protein